jgi:hypothetical protein
MKIIATLIIALCAAATLRADTDAEVNARKNVLDLAGAFTNDGFKLRDGHWVGEIRPNQRTLVAVNLYAGNQYWFAASAPEEGKRVSVDLFDETGHPVTAEHLDENGRAAAGFSPKDSGQYFVAIGVPDGNATSVCLVYSYK